MAHPHTVQIEVSLEEFNTVLAALRYYQQQGLGNPANRPGDINAIATNCGESEGLDCAAITQLCHRLNCA